MPLLRIFLCMCFNCSATQGIKWYIYKRLTLKFHSFPKKLMKILMIGFGTLEKPEQIHGIMNVRQRPGYLSGKTADLYFNRNISLSEKLQNKINKFFC